MSFASPFPDVEIPDQDVYSYLFGDLTDSDAGRVALVEVGSGAQLSYGELVARIDAFAGSLTARGILAGDVVGLLAPNSIAFAIAFHGILRTGAAATTINILFTADEIAKQLVDSKARLLFTIDPLAARARDAAAVEVIVLSDDFTASGVAAPDVTIDPGAHLAVLPYSSGTTGKPKGVMLTHRNLVANVAQHRGVVPGMRSDDAVLAVLPFFHIYGMTILLNAALRARARLVVMPSFDLSVFLETIQKHRVTVAYIAPPIAVALAKHPLVADYDLSSLRALYSGAAPLDGDLGHAVAERLGCQVIQGYGMTELSPASHGMPYDGGAQTLGVVASLNSVGWTVPNAVSKIVDPETGAEIGRPSSGLSAAGELWFAGPNVMAGYLGNAEATAETVDTEGFLHTGDMACVDSHGCIYIVERLKELIKYKGYQVPPAELEALLLTHPGIADAAVIGVIDEETGEEIPKAFVVKQSGADLGAAEVMDFVAERVAPYKKVRRVEFIDVVPKSASGKILRKDLRARR